MVTFDGQIIRLKHQYLNMLLYGKLIAPQLSPLYYSCINNYHNKADDHHR